MYIKHKIECAIVGCSMIVTVYSSVVFVFLLAHTNAANIDDISGSMGLKAAVGSVAVISLLASWSLLQEYLLVSGLRDQVKQILWKDDMDVLSINDDQHALITYDGGVYYAVVTCLNSLQQTLYVINEYSVDIYQKDSLEVQILTSANSAPVTVASSVQTKLAVMKYKREMSVLIKALKQHWKQVLPPKKRLTP